MHKHKHWPSPALTSWASGAGKQAGFPGAWSPPSPLGFPSLLVGQDTLGYWLLLGHLQKFSFVASRNVCCGANPARCGGERGWGGEGGRACYQGDWAGRASALQIWSARAHSHGHVPPRKGRSEREGPAARRLHDRAPSSSGAGPSPWGRRRRGEGGARGKAFGAGCLPGFPSSLPACSPRPEPPSARRPVPGPAGDGEAVLTSRRGPCLGAGCGNVPGQWD